MDGKAGGSKTGQSKRRSVVKTDSPDCFPGSVCFLSVGQVTHPVPDRLIHTGSLHFGIGFTDEGQGGKNRSRAFGKGVIHHDVGKDMGRIEDFDPLWANYPVATSPASIAVLVTQDEANSCLDRRTGSGGWKKRLRIDQSEKAFGGAICDRPTVAAFAEGPSAFSRESVITPGSGEFLDHLIFQKVAASAFDHPSGGEFRTEVGHSLESERGVPDF